MQQNEADTRNIRNHPKKIIHLMLFVVLSSLACVGIFKIFITSGDSTLLDNKFYKKSYDIYAPIALPEKFSIDIDSVESNATVTTYSITNESGDMYFVSIQPLPRQSIIDDFLKNQMSSTTSIDTNIGSAMIGVVLSRETASIVTKKSWILITSPLGTSRNNLEKIVSEFKVTTDK